jgi:ubiquinol-cytochrome c reductase cytochrome b subunit
MKTIFRWLEKRTGIENLVDYALKENIPGGSRWRYVWGSTLTFAFMVQIITGFFLWSAYSPSAQTAWPSVYYIQHEMLGGWLLRGIHHFTAQVMILLLGLHLLQVVWDGAYRAPREMNFWFGLVLLNLVLALSLTGYLLPWDQKGYWATKVATNILGVAPVFGGALQRVLMGGTDYGHHTLTRFFALHAGVLPSLIMVLMVGHIYLFRRHGITAKQPFRKPFGRTNCSRTRSPACW